MFDQERRNLLKLLGIGSGAVLFNGIHFPLAFASGPYPQERITYICYTKPGGGFDFIARSAAPYLGKYLKELSREAKGGEVVVKDVPGGGGQKAYSNIFHAKPNGYIIGDFNTFFVTQKISSKVDFAYEKFTYLVRTSASSWVIAANKNGFKNWEEMLRAGKGKELKWAVAGFGLGGHVAGILLLEEARLPARMINFPGMAENTNALLRGDVDIATLSAESAKVLIESGEVRVLAALSETSQYPGVPSIAQLGYPDLASSLKLHRMVIGPPNLPKEIADTLIIAYKKMFADSEFLDRAKKMDFAPDPVYGADAQRLAQKIFKYFEEKAPILNKYLG